MLPVAWNRSQVYWKMLFSDIGVADPTRRRILELLRAGDMTAGELAEHFDISKPSLSHHLATLRNAGLVTDERHGQNIVYSLNTTVMQDLVGWFNYGHPHNRFWPVMAAVFHDDSCLCENTDPIQTVRTRKGFALRHHMALWDVIASCDIEGANDVSIRNAVPNDFPICSGSRKSPIYLPLARRLRSCTSDSAFRYYRRMGRTMCR